MTPSSGSGPANLQVSVSGASLAAGAYAGTITLTSTGAAGSPLTVSVELTVAPAPALSPAISSGGIIGGAGSVPAVTTVSPGGLASVFGSNFAVPGTARAVQSSDLVNGALPTILADTCVLAGGHRAFLTFVSPSQINVQIPAVAVDGAIEVQVLSNCGAANESRSASIRVPTAAASPELLYWTGGADGRRPVVAVNAVTGAYIGAAGLIPGLGFAPARPGDVLTIYGISFGPTNPAVAPGDAPASVGPTVAAPRCRSGPSNSLPPTFCTRAYRRASRGCTSSTSACPRTCPMATMRSSCGSVASEYARDRFSGGRGELTDRPHGPSRRRLRSGDYQVLAPLQISRRLRARMPAYMRGERRRTKARSSARRSS